MSRAPLDAGQLEQARRWAAELGVPAEAVIADAQGAKDGGYREAAQSARGHEAGWTERMAGAGGGQMAAGRGPEPAEAEAG